MKGVLFIFSVLIVHSNCILNLNLESYLNEECLSKKEALFHQKLPECIDSIEIYKMYKTLHVNFYPDNFMAAYQSYVTFSKKKTTNK